MKRIYLSLLMLITFITSLAQFSLTPTGFVADTEKDFYVENINGTQQELFNKVKTVITEMMVSADDATSYNEYDIISLRVHIPKITIFSWAGIKSYWDCTASFKILFKDNRIRFNAPSFDNDFQQWLNPGKRNALTGENHLFNIKNNKPYYKESVIEIQDKINEIINFIVEKTKNNENEEW